MIGIEKIKEASTIVVSVAEKLEKALSDGKIGWLEALGLIKLKDISFLFSNAKDILAELKDLDASEKADLVSHVKFELDLENDNIEYVIEKSLEIFAGMTDVVAKMSLIHGGPGDDPTDDIKTESIHGGPGDDPTDD